MTNKNTVSLMELIEQYKKSNLNYKLPIILGESKDGKPKFADLVDLEHILMTGTTGSGKSVFEEGVILTLMSLFSPDELRLILVDMKRVELTLHNGSPYLLAPVVVDYDKFYSTFDWLIFEKNARLKWDKSFLEKAPHIVAIIDTFSDLHYENPIKFQAYMSQLIYKTAVVKIHIIMSDSRAGDTKMYTPLICGLFPTKICFNVSLAQYSKEFIGIEGGEKLKGEGDMLFLPPNRKEAIRLQSPYISGEEINKFDKVLDKVNNKAIHNLTS